MNKALIVTDKQKLLVRDEHPTRITTVIPTSKIVNYRGVDLVVMPHDLDEVRVLNNMGYNIDSPVSHYYKYSGRYTPFVAQAVTTDKMTLNTRMFVLNQIGTGKTLATAWAYDYLRSRGKVKKMLIVTPLSTMERVWADEFFHHFPHLTCQVLYGTAKRRVAQLEFPADVYIINHDGLKVPEIRDALLKRDDIDVVTIDELASFRNSSTDRWKALSKVIAGKQYVWGLTGTPIPNRPTDAWAQCRLIAPSRVPPYFGRFREMVERKVSQFKWVARDNALDTVREAMQPAVLFRRDECVDLPPTMYESRYVEMSPEQKRAYKQMINSLVAEASAGQIVAVNEAVKAAKLAQIACGVAYDQEGKCVQFECKDRIEELKEIIRESGSKVIVFVPLTGGLEMVAAEVAKEWQTAVVHGGVGKTERDGIFSDFQTPGGLHVLVAHPRCMSHGLTLTEASTIVWFIPTNSHEEYEQANGRITRPGQKLNTLIMHIEGSDIERRMYKRLETKSSMQNLLLDMIKEQLDEQQKQK
jgi:SNF2 family DNA or RNA helicase